MTPFFTAIMRILPQREQAMIADRFRRTMADEMVAVYAAAEVAMSRKHVRPVTSESLAWFRRVWIGSTVALFGTATALTVWSALCSTEF